MAVSDYAFRLGNAAANAEANAGFPSILNAEQIMDKKYNKLFHIVPGVIPQG